MSVQAITWALGKAPNLASQAVLFSLANYANEWGITFVGQDTIAVDCSCRRPTVTANMTKLEDDGLIARVRRHDPGGRRTSDVIVLAPRWADRAPMASADKAAESMFSAEVCALARLGSPGVPSPDSLGSDDDRLGTPDVSLGTLGVHEPLEEPLEEPTASSSASARELWPGVPDEMRSDALELLRAKRKVDRHLVSERELGIAAAALSEFNRQADSDYGLGAHLTSIVMRIRERPSWDAAKHVRLVASAWRIRWWERSGNGRRPSPNVIYGERSFENVVQDAMDEAAGKKIESASSSGLLKNKVWPDGRSWDELTPDEQANAKEAVAMGLEPWKPRDVHTLAASNGHAAAVTSATFLDPD